MALLLCCIASLAFSASASDQEVHASITTRVSIQLSKNADINFGIVEYLPAHTGLIQLGTDKSVSLSGASGLTLAGGTPTSGDVDISGDGSSVVDVSCESSATLSDGAGGTLQLVAVELAIGAGQPFGSGQACAGLGTVAATVDLSLSPSQKILIGGAIDTDSDPIDGASTYDTALAGGNPVTIRAVYQ